MSHRLARIIAFLAYGLTIYAMGFFWWYKSTDGFIPTLLVSSLCLGVIAQVLFDLDLKNPLFSVVLWAIDLTAVMFAILLALGVESAICLVIGAPIVIPLEIFGVWLARYYLRYKAGDAKAGKIHATVFLLPVLVLPLNGHIPYPATTRIVTSEIIINAPADAVWAHTVIIPEIQPEERIWTLSHAVLGAPQPVSAALDGDIRQLRWTKGVRFQEIITERELHKRLAWDFHFNDLDSLASFDPHVSPNSRMLQVRDGFYKLTPLAGGRTLLRLETTYVIRSPFNGYLHLWGNLFLNDFHDSVLAVIKSRAEAKGDRI